MQSEIVAARLDELYARLPKIACQRKCWRSCYGPIPLTVFERDRLMLHVGLDRQTRSAPSNAPPPCAMLSPTRSCNAYTIRPLICRLYGAARALACPFGCVPDRWIEDGGGAGPPGRGRGDSTRMIGHVHKWATDGDCDGVLTLVGRAVPCHARRCAAPGCTTRRDAPADYCKDHAALGRRLLFRL